MATEKGRLPGMLPQEERLRLRGRALNDMVGIGIGIWDAEDGWMD
jgi:hypothetical protein